MNVRANWQTERDSEELKDAKVRAYLFHQQKYIEKDER